MRLAIVVLMMAQLAWLGRAQAIAESPGPRSVTEQIDRAVQLSLDAEFELALAAFDRLLVTRQLDDESLARVLGERSVVLFALHQQNALDEDLERLVLIAPNAKLSDRAPPELLERWHSIQQERVVPVVKHAALPTPRAVARREVQGPYVAARTREPTMPVLPPESERHFNPRAWWIGGALVTAATVVAVTLALTVPSAPADRTAIKPRVEF